MPTKEIEEFARVLIEQVRDRAIENCDINLRPNAMSETARRWRSAGVHEPTARLVTPEAVDAALYFLLYAIDDGLLPLHWEDKDGKLVNLGEEGLGELAGWYIGDDGWRKTFSRQRRSDEGG